MSSQSSSLRVFKLEPLTHHETRPVGTHVQVHNLLSNRGPLALACGGAFPTPEQGDQDSHRGNTKLASSVTELVIHRFANKFRCPITGAWLHCAADQLHEKWIWG